MKATETNFLKFLDGNKQLIIPIYQRPYSWTITQCQQLWNDVLRAANDDRISGHFIGSLVHMADSIYLTAAIPKLLVIDGQQRLTTLTLILSILSKAIKATSEEFDITSDALEDFYLFNRHAKGNERYKLLLNQKDRETLIFLLEDKEIPDNSSPRIVENYRHFDSQIRKLDIDLNSLYRGICKLMIVEISLERDRDDPQLIFESLNSTGLELSEADKIRNYVLMGLQPDEQEEIYKYYWHPMEQNFDNMGNSEIFDRFIRDYLTIKSRSGTIPNIKDVYSSFKVYVQGQKNTLIKNIVADIYRYSKYFVKLALAQETDQEIRQVITDINTLKVDVAYPFLIEVYDDYIQNKINMQEFIKILKLVESYVFRRSICGIATNSMNKTFATLIREIDPENYLESLQITLSRKSNYQRFPDDDEFRREFIVKDIYNFRGRNYLLRKLENYERKELISIENYTIEHIMPQNSNLSLEWQADLGQQWKEIQGKYLHTIGNLTLTGYNSELSDHPFIEKRDMQNGGFADSPLRMNRGLRHLEHWNEIEINNRAVSLADIAIKAWTFSVVNLDNQNLDLNQVILDIFPNIKFLTTAKEYIQKVVDSVGYDKIGKILSINYRKEKAISVNLGQWLVLRLKRNSNVLETVFAIDFEQYSNTELMGIYKVETISNRWAGDRDIKLVWLEWDYETSLPEEFLEAWHSAIRYANQVFRGWASSSYMNYHQTELAQALISETPRSHHADTLQGETLKLFDAIRK
ncbi:DUF262 domain-containing protein [Nostoc sp.]|uniref:DUF262 domain-containing protein n=1 Tax=Nostoc sp. TaxID=1180 RepID=UPI002FFA550D